MAKAKNALGRGLNALLGDMEPIENAAAPNEDGSEAVRLLKLTSIDVNRNQPRKHFDEQALNELADSIKAVGIISPILVRPINGRYQIIAGERRFRAARIAGLTELPAIVRDLDERTRYEVTLIENLQRDDLNPVEHATGIRQLMTQYHYTQETVAERLGSSRSAVANMLRLLTLPNDILSMMESGALSAGHGRALVTLKNKETQLKLAEMTVSQGWSVRQLERICAGQAEEKLEPRRKEPVRRDPELNELERMARDIFGTRAKIEGDGEKGKLVLTYFSADDLQRIYEILEIMQQNA